MTNNLSNNCKSKFKETAARATQKALEKTLKTVIWILKIVLPISLIVSFLQFFGFIDFLSELLTPFFVLIGLPGEAAIVFISSLFLPLYAPIAIIATLSLSLREITILALMCLTTHNLVVETAVQSKTGSRAWILAPMRIVASILVALLLNWLLPTEMGSGNVSEQSVAAATSVVDVIVNWLKMAGNITMKLTLIITALMLIQSFLKEFNLINKLSQPFAPFMKMCGLNANSSFLWIIAQVVGITYGSAVILEEVKENALPQRQVDLINYHVALNHSLLEDNFLFVAMGVPLLWIIVPRLIFALVAVWTARFIFFLKDKKRYQSTN